MPRRERVVVAPSGGVDSSVHPGNEGSIRAILDEPLRDITPGQGAVFYQEEILLGGGIITERPPNVDETEVI